MVELSEFLLVVRCFSGDGRLFLENVFRRVEDSCLGLKSSSIYRVKKTYKAAKDIHDIRSEESYDGLVSVLRGKTNLPLNNFFSEMKSVEKEFQSEVLHRSADLRLLVFNYETIMTPRLTVPHPEFHRHPEEIVLASEVWGAYVHPILSERLDVLERRFAGDEWGEFYSQGITQAEV